MWCKTATRCFTLRNKVLSRLCNSWHDLAQFNAADDALEKIQSLKEHSAWSKNVPHSWHGEDNSWRVHSFHICPKEHAGSLLLKYMAGGRSYTEVVPGRPVWSIIRRARLESSRIISQQLQPPHNGAKLEKKKTFPHRICAGSLLGIGSHKNVWEPGNGGYGRSVQEGTADILSLPHSFSLLLLLLSSSHNIVSF